MTEVARDVYTDELPEMVRDQLGTLPERQREQFFAEYEHRRRSRVWAWVLWAIGWHIGYIERRWGFNVLYVLAFGVTLGVWWLIEAFRVNLRLRNHRHRAAVAVLSELRAISAV